MKLPLHHLAAILDVDARWQAVESVAHPSAPQVIYASGRFGHGSVRAHDIDGIRHIRLEIILFGIAQLIAQIVVDIIATLVSPGIKRVSDGSWKRRTWQSFVDG